MPITTDRLGALLREYVRDTGATIDLLLVGGLALQAYGLVERATQDIDGELIGDPEPLAQYLRGHQIPADLGENMSGWSVVAMPPGYRDRASVFLEEPGLRMRLLSPADFIIAKLRRGAELDLEDALYVARRFGVTTTAVQNAAEAAIGASPKDTALFAFRKIVQLFCGRLENL
ncbi:MAG: hypothetical protein HZA21_00100 [Nitrospirae bacterium]|nr:hypothetical protein [Nitrospirota bacterium]